MVTERFLYGRLLAPPVEGGLDRRESIALHAWLQRGAASEWMIVRRDVTTADDVAAAAAAEDGGGPADDAYNTEP